MGKLFIVATPIGNLADITVRALDILKKVDIIAAEDTRHTKKLLTHYDIHRPLMSFHEHNEQKGVAKVIDMLKEGSSVALVSDAGTPSISDPGFRLVREAVAEGMNIEMIPGPSAVISALSISGLPTDQWTFVGFLNDKEGKRKKKLEELKDYGHTIVFYVSKWKVEKVLSDMLEIFGDRQAAFCRELTKLHEEVVREPLSALLARFKEKEVKGEITLVVEGKCDAG